MNEFDKNDEVIEFPSIDIPLCGIDDNDEEPMGMYDYTGLEGLVE